MTSTTTARLVVMPPRSGRPVLRAAALTAAVPAVTAVVVAVGFGWLYLLARSGLLDAGPRFADALALQRLAGGASQPLARVVATWLPAGLVAGWALAALGLRSRPARFAAAGAAGFALLALLGAAADAVTSSERLDAHLQQQPHRPAIWLAAALLAAGAAVAR